MFKTSTAFITLFLVCAALYADFTLFQLDGISKKKISTHRTLQQCLDAGKNIPSIECSGSLTRKRAPKKQSHVESVCNQEGR